MYTQLRWSLNVVLGVDKFLAFPFNKTNFIQSYRMLTQVLYCDQPMSRTDMAGGILCSDSYHYRTIYLFSSCTKMWLASFKLLFDLLNFSEDEYKFVLQVDIPSAYSFLSRSPLCLCSYPFNGFRCSNWWQRRASGRLAAALLQDAAVRLRFIAYSRFEAYRPVAVFNEEKVFTRFSSVLGPQGKLVKTRPHKVIKYIRNVLSIFFRK